MAQEVATLGIIDDSADWNPPAALPLNLRSQLQKFGIGNDDLVIIEGLPEGADLTVGICKPDGSWSVRAAEMDNAAFIPLYENGETYTVKLCLLTPDPSDHGLPKTKGKTQFKLSVPLAPLPVLEAFDQAPPKKAAPATDTVIILGADPSLKTATPPPAAAAPAIAAPQAPAAPQPMAAPQIPAPRPAAPAPQAPAAVVPQPTAAAVVAPAPQPVAATPQPAPTPPVAATAPAAPVAAPAAAMPAIDFEAHFAALRIEWHTNVKNQVSAAEKRLKAAHLQQLSKIQTVLSQEETARTNAIATKWKAEMERRAATAEAELKTRATAHLVGLEAQLHEAVGAGAAAGSMADFEARLAAARQQWQAEEAARMEAAEAAWNAAAMMQVSKPAADPEAVKRAVAEARAAWEIEEAGRRAKDAAELAAAHQRQVTQLEAQHAALNEMRMNAADAAWRKAEEERLAAAELTWSKREAERVAAVEAKWRSDHDKRLEVVLANLDTMVKGQIGNIDGSQPLPAIEPTMAAPTMPAPTAMQAEDRSAAEAPTVAEDTRWRKTAAA